MREKDRRLGGGIFERVREKGEAVIGRNAPGRDRTQEAAQGGINWGVREKRRGRSGRNTPGMERKSEAAGGGGDWTEK